jgi:O-antigen biosynthesis protein
MEMIARLQSQNSESPAWRVARTIRRFLGPIKRLFAISGIPPKLYHKWIKKYGVVSPELRAVLAADIATWVSPPLISLAVPNCNVDCMWLNQSIVSVRNQVYPHWQLCISYDQSTNPEIKLLLERYAAQDPRICVKSHGERIDRSANANAGLALVKGDYIALMDAGDLLSEDALFWVAREIALHPEVDLLFSDEDKIDSKGRRFDPYFKSAWNPALMLSQNAFSHLGIYRRSIVEQVGRFREGYEGAEEYDLVLRCAEQTNAARIRHIPHVLYHWRDQSDSTAPQTPATSVAWRAGRAAITDHLRRAGIKAHVKEAHHSYYQVEYDTPRPPPLVSIVVPTTLSNATITKCLLSVLTESSYDNFELLILVHAKHLLAAETNPAVTKILADHRTRLISYEHADFNFSRVSNLGGQSARGALLCFLNDDVEVITTDWLERLVARAIIDGVGAVGSMLYYPSDLIQHAGLLLGVGGVADRPFNGLRRGAFGYFGRAGLEQDYSCVTAACVLMTRSVFESVGGFDEALPAAYNDVDLCCKIRRTGARIVWTPSVEMVHHESFTFGHHDTMQRRDQFRDDVKIMSERWKEALEADPCYNPNLSLMHGSMFSLAWPPRLPTPKQIVPGGTRSGISRTSQFVA